MRIGWAIFALGAVSALAAGPASAENGWIVTIGGRMSASPPYEGADHDIFAPSPTLSVRRADSPDRFEPPDDGTTFSLINTKYVVLGPMARFRYPRGDGGKLAGMTPIELAIEPGAFINIWPTNWLRARVEGRRGILGHDGWVGDAALDLVYTGSRWRASLGPRMGYGDARYMDTYFGVTPIEAARSPLITAAYEPGAGTRYMGVEAGLSYRLTGGLQTVLDFGYHRLSDTVAASPIIQAAGSRTQLTAGVGIKYSFHVGG